MNLARTTDDSATPGAAILLILVAGLLFSFLDTGAKYLVVSGLSAPFVAWIRFAVHTALVLLLFRAWAAPASRWSTHYPRRRSMR